MDLKELESGIFEAVTKGMLAAPQVRTECHRCGEIVEEDDDGWARWVQELTLFIYELCIRSRQKKLKFDDAKKLAWHAAKRRIRDERADMIMNIRLPHEPEGLYTATAEQICECGGLKSEEYPKCLKCAQKPYEQDDPTQRSP